MATPDPQFVPARYIGHNKIRLVKGLRPYQNADGTRRAALAVNRGDVLLMPAAEILGQTYLIDPKCQRDPLYLGVGKRVLPEHQHLDARELALLGYEFHGGRADFELVEDDPAPDTAAAAAPIPANSDTPAPARVAQGG